MKASKLFMLLVLAVGVCAQAHPYTLTFDDIPSGYGLIYYGGQYGVAMGGGWYIADHSQSTWGPPHSGNNVLRYWWDYLGTDAYISFKSYQRPSYSVYSLGAYFSTEAGALLRMTAYDKNMNPIALSQIGTLDGSWDNVYAEVRSTQGSIWGVGFEGVSSPDALFHFAADDMTIVPVPEPSSLLALAGGLGALGFPLIRRRRGR